MGNGTRHGGNAINGFSNIRKNGKKEARKKYISAEKEHITLA